MKQRSLLLVFIVFATILGLLYFIPATCTQLGALCLGDPHAPLLAPTVYRILPSLLERLIAPTIDPYSVTMLFVDELIQAACIAVIIPALYAWLARWLEPDRAVIGVLVFSVVYVMAFHLWFRSVSSTIEILLVTVGLALIERRWCYFVPLIVLASFNRETAVVLAGIYGAYHGRGKWRETAILIGIWAMITAGLHLAIGGFPHVLGLQGTLTYNLDNLPDAILSNLLFIPIGIMTIYGLKYAPTPLQRLALVAGVYLLAIVIGGAWNEAERLCLPLIPLLLPIMLTQSALGVTQPFVSTK